ncbi:MAG: T9SS type A sorting domain-containing protein, partial [Bacteroidales bacterium]|nr:T9SS type A sorting domain-containing protein [Bacteroidales bacterium]
DLFGWSRGFCDDPLVMDNTICFSEGTDLEELFYFNSGSDKAYLNDEGTYTVPYLQGVTPVEFITNTSNSTDPITLSYITGIEFPVLCSVGIEEFASANGVNVTQNIPNPFIGSTTIEVSTETAATVTVEVSNIMGQSIYTLNAGIINGTQEIELSAENLEAGIYFYTVRVGNESITKKMIVE